MGFPTRRQSPTIKASIAKIVAQMAEFTIFELIRHLGQTHLALEPIALATARELAQNHPLHVLLQPHFELTMAIDAFGDRVLVNPGGGVDLILPGILDSRVRFFGPSADRERPPMSCAGATRQGGRLWTRFPQPDQSSCF
ncbi:MAG: hypothetical protein GDA38_19225 [Hormoscilla sp. SP12CHS1]|nr:hypothetical protein [Hormoscilla sp. SP12CHS1]